MGTSGDKIVLLDGMGSGSGSAAPMGLTWVMVVEYTTTMARSMTAEWMS